MYNDDTEHVIDTSLGAYLGTDGIWHDSSDKAMKQDFAIVDRQATLAAVAELPLNTWNRIGTDPSVRHLGPTAQDFYAAFGLGADDKHIAALDTSGVALAAIQGLNEKVDEKDAGLAQEVQRCATRTAGWRRGWPPWRRGAAGPARADRQRHPCPGPRCCWRVWHWGSCWPHADAGTERRLRRRMWPGRMGAGVCSGPTAAGPFAFAPLRVFLSLWLGPPVLVSVSAPIRDHPRIRSPVPPHPLSASICGPVPRPSPNLPGFIESSQMVHKAFKWSCYDAPRHGGKPYIRERNPSLAWTQEAGPMATLVKAEPRKGMSSQTQKNWLVDAGLFVSAILAGISGIYFLFLPSGGFQGGRNPMYGITVLFDRHTWDDLHTWTGLAMIVVAVVHFAIHWKWVKNMASRVAKELTGKYPAMTGKGRFNLVLNLTVAVSGLITAVSGIYFFFWPSEQGASASPVILFTSATWDILHTWAGVVMIIAAVAHFAIHWRWVVNVTRNTLSTAFRREASEARNSAPVTA